MRILLLSLSLVLLVFTISVNAQILVDTAADTIADDGMTSLREAVEAANSDTGVQTITFDPAVFPIDSGTVIYLDSVLFLTDPAGVFITGDGAEVILYGGEPAPGGTNLPGTLFYSGFVLEGGNNQIAWMKFKNF